MTTRATDTVTTPQGIAKLTWMCLKRMLVLRGLSGSDLATCAAGTYMRWKLSQAVLLGLTALARAVRKSRIFTHPKVCRPPIVTLNRSTCVTRHAYACVWLALRMQSTEPYACLPPFVTLNRSPNVRRHAHACLWLEKHDPRHAPATYLCSRSRMG